MYFLISGIDRTRDSFIQREFETQGILDVQWITSHNKTELDEEFIAQVSDSDSLKVGQVSATYKHYLALSAIAQSTDDFGIVFEDNIEFRGNFLRHVDDICYQNYGTWDFIFEGDTMPVPISHIIRTSLPLNRPRLLKKSNRASRRFGGASNGANCYIVTPSAAAIVVADFLPFPKVIDHYFNDLFRKYSLRVYWPSDRIVHRIRRRSTLQFDD